MIGLSISGATTAFLDLTIAGARLQETLRAAVRDLAAEYDVKLKTKLSGGGRSGRHYGAGTGAGRFRKRLRATTVFGRAAKVREVVSVKVRTRAYTASAPGEAPATRTGTLLRSVRVKFPARQKGFGAKVFAHRGFAPYRHLLEFGHELPGHGIRKPKYKAGRKRVVNTGRVRPRPVFSPLQAQLEAELERRVARAADLFAVFGG